MNELEPYEAEDCGRCHDTLGDQRFSLAIDGEPALPSPIEVWICERCMESMTRWMRRGQAPPRSEGRETVSERPSRKARSKRREDRRSHYTAVLDRNEKWIHRKNRMILWLTLGSVATVLGLIYYAVVTDAVKSLQFP
ncbi:MAG: hypothetical protein AB7I30_17960 [Isosphaeraceae bacterium]